MLDSVATNTNSVPESTLLLHESGQPPLRFGLTHLFALISAVAILLAIWRLEEYSYVAWAVVAIILEIAIGLYWHYRSIRAPVLWLLGCFSLAIINPPTCSLTGDIAHRMRCLHHMRQLTLGLHKYEIAHGHFPPAYTVDDQGRPMHSWRVLILPYIDEALLYQEFRLDEPWDSPHNLALAQKMPDVFRCPSSQRGPTQWTNYVAPVGPQSMWPEHQTITLRDIGDWESRTIALIEWPESNILWTEPRDLPADNLTPLTHPAWEDFRNRHRPDRNGDVAVGFADGTVSFLSLPKLSPLTLRALITPNGGEQIDHDDLYP